MKKIDREIYRVLSGEVNYLICSFCKHGFFSGSPCSGGEYECDHPLRDRIGHPFSDGYIEPYQDCWAFRKDKRLDPAICADIVGVIISEGFESTAWSFDQNGVAKVIGGNQ